MKTRKPFELKLIDYIRDKETPPFKENARLEKVIKNNLDKIDWEKFKEGTLFNEQIFVLNYLGGIYNKYWVKKEYLPNYVYKKINSLFDTSQSYVEKDIEHIKWMAMQGRIEVIKY